MTNPLRFIFAGSGEFGAPTLRLLVKSGHQIVKVFTQPDRPAGRGKILTPTPIARLADEMTLSVTRTADINAEELPAADIMIVIAFGQKISEPAVHHPRLGSINLHASLLPKYRGAAPINHAILNGETITGNSIIRLASKMDAGNILAQSQLKIGDTETAGELHDRLSIDGAPLVEKVLAELAAGTSHESEQDHAAATIAPKLRRENATLDWSLSATTLKNRINGLSPWPGCRIRLIDAAGSDVGRLTLLRARASATKNPCTAGEVTEQTTIAAGNGQALEILDVQPEGKRPMSLSDYRRGNRWVAGLRVESI